MPKDDLSDTVYLSAIVREGLQSLSTVISLELTKKVISNAVKMALHSSKYLCPMLP